MPSPRLGLAAILACTAGPAWAVEPPDGIRQMIWTALDTKDPETIARVVAVAKQAAPESAAEIDIIAEQATTRVVEQAMPRPRRQPPPEPESALTRALPKPPTPPHWRGSVEIGAARSTGNTDSLALYGEVDLSLQDLEWTHKVNARADYQETGRNRTAERFSLAYQPQLQLRGTLYTYGLGQYDHDRFLGYRNRFTLGVGAGLTPVSRPDFTVSLDAGPALRHTEFYDLPTKDTVAGRASLSVKWAPGSNVTLSHDMALYLESDRTTARSTTALDTLVFGPLKARLSYNVELEKDGPTDRRDVDTTTRASLVYGF